ncbi:unnamed protein product [Moneuplotes crassus]|uniref:dipeptidyl-peptidase I n=1 Tax=Euplotes crassus TaxID=5936 RepID=A0AAD1XBA2_EUPCR|nr:unnamed protein product [Moneuplotes crassus]
MKIVINKINIILICCLLYISKADNPVRCTLHEIIGDWTFVLSTDTFKPDLHSQKITCGKGQPGKIPKINKDHKFEFKSSRNLDLKLTKDNRAISSTNSGAFTILLQEGILVTIGNLILNASFRYNYVGDNNGRMSGELYESICSQTMVGWYHTKDNTVWGCFYAYKNSRTPEDFGGNNHAMIDLDGILYTPETLKDESYWDGDEPSSHFSIYETRVNQATANPGMPYFDPFSLVGREPSSIAENELPEYLNWADVNGESYFPEIISQQCGECYIEAFLHAYESRTRILSRNKFQPRISREQILGCNFYSEGCDGGLPIAAAKFANEFFMVDEECYSQKCIHPTNISEAIRDDVCCDKCDNERVKYKVGQYGYVGGYYGASTELGIMREIAARGPVSAVLNAPDDFLMYIGGIAYLATPVRNSEISRISDYAFSYFISASKNKISKKTMRDLDLEFEYANHSVVILGWGYDEELDLEYWICANSWGKDWGEKGFFRIVRGTNEMGIETAAEYFTVLVEIEGIPEIF